MILPAWKSADSPVSPSKSAAILSAFTNSSTWRLPARSFGATVDFPAPLGPAMTKRFGPLLVCLLSSTYPLTAIVGAPMVPDAPRALIGWHSPSHRNAAGET